MAIVHFVNYKKGTQSRAAMRGVMHYVMQEKKTTWEGGPLVSGINCQPQSVYDDFLNTKLLYHKDGGVMFYHMVQSFPKGAAVNPRQAHEAARQLAEQFFLLVDDHDPFAETAGGDVIAHGHVSLCRQCPDLLAVSGCHARAEFDIFFIISDLSEMISLVPSESWGFLKGGLVPL